MQREARARTGWANEEKNLMWDEVKRTSQEGGTLKHAFDAISEKTGRKPNSIRNFYYQSLKEQGVPEEMRAMRARPFVPFVEDEIGQLLRAVLTARANGVSVRACVQKLGDGDRALALRYQNKYRSILKSHPELIEQTMKELRAEGIDCPSPYETTRARRAMRRQMEAGVSVTPNADADELLGALRRLIDRGGTHNEMRHREEIDRMTVRCDLLRLELARREELMLEAQRAQDEIRSGALALVEACQELLSAQDIETAKAIHPLVQQKIAGVSSLLSEDEQ